MHLSSHRHPAQRLLAWAGVLCVLGALAARGNPATGMQATGRRDAPEKIAIFGIDAADWRVIDPLIAAGRLPTFARLKGVGAIGVLKAEPPLLSPLIWTTIATGRSPEDHGVLDFMVDEPGGGQAPVSGSARRVKALWEIWSKAGRNVLVTGWWATWPADEVRGVLVSDRIATPHLRTTALPELGLVFPPDRWPEVAANLVKPEAIDYATLSRLVPLGPREFEQALAAERASTAMLYRNPIAHFRAALAAERTYRRVSVGLVGAVDPAFWATYYELVDTASHLFIKDKAKGDAAIASAYVEMDQALAEVARALDPATFLLVVSDHGFEVPAAAIREDPADLTSGATAWHRPYGIIAATTAGALAGGAPTMRFAPIGTVSPLDIAPTLLARAGLAVASDMPGRIIPALAPPANISVARIASYGAHDLPSVRPGAASRISKAEVERLRALGYVAGGGAKTSLSRVNLGEILFRKGDFRGAQRELEAVLRADPLNEHGALWLARTYAALGKPDEAARVYDGLIRSAATTGKRTVDPLVFLAATDLDLEQGRVGAAAERLAHVPTALMQSSEVRVARGALAEAQGYTDEAERQYRAALSAAASDTEALQRLVTLLLGTSRPQQAAAEATRAARAYPSSPVHLSLAGEAALAERRYQDAQQYFAAALALSPETVSVRIDLARAQLLDEKPDRALESLAALSPSVDVDMLRGAAYSARNEWPAAVTAFERALSATAPTIELLNALGNAQLRVGRAAEAVKTLEQSLALNPNQPEIRTLLETARRAPGSNDLSDSRSHFEPVLH